MLTRRACLTDRSSQCDCCLLEGGMDMSSPRPVSFGWCSQTGLKPESLQRVETNNQPVSSPGDGRSAAVSSWSVYRSIRFIRGLVARLWPIICVTLDKGSAPCVWEHGGDVCCFTASAVLCVETLLTNKDGFTSSFSGPGSQPDIFQWISGTRRYEWSVCGWDRVRRHGNRRVEKRFGLQHSCVKNSESPLPLLPFQSPRVRAQKCVFGAPAAARPRAIPISTAVYPGESGPDEPRGALLKRTVSVETAR